MDAMHRATGLLYRLWDSDFLYSLRSAPTVVVAALVAIVYTAMSVAAPLVAPHQVFDVTTLNVLDAFVPPAWLPQGRMDFLLGSDEQGRDVLSTILFGSRAKQEIEQATLEAMNAPLPDFDE